MDADDSQLYLSCDIPNNPHAFSKKIEACIADIQRWMPLNGLKLNDGETEFLALHSCRQPTLPPSLIIKGNDSIDPSLTAKNQGVTINATLTP